MSELEVKLDNTKVVISEISTAIERALEKIGLVAEGHAVGYETAVDTGRLRNSITHAVSEGEKAVYIGTNVEYAPYIELGTSKYAGIKFLTKAASNHGDEYREILKDELSK